MYIRTKYEIVKVETIADIQTKVIFKDNFVAQSENLDELCDEFVMTHYFPETNYTHREVLKAGKDAMIEGVRLKKIHNKDEDLKNEFNIYGAVWTDKGLIYVAKMNLKK